MVDESRHRRKKMRKRELGAYSPTVGGQVDSQAHVAVRKAHEAAAVAILLRSPGGRSRT